MRLDGFGIMVDDMATMVRFYRDVLGFEIKEDIFLIAKVSTVTMKSPLVLKISQL